MSDENEEPMRRTAVGSPEQYGEGLHAARTYGSHGTSRNATSTIAQRWMKGHGTTIEWLITLPAKVMCVRAGHQRQPLTLNDAADAGEGIRADTPVEEDGRGVPVG